MKNYLENIINSVTSPILAGKPVRDSENHILDFEILFTNKAFQDALGDCAPTLSQLIEEESSLASSVPYFQMAVNAVNGIANDEITYYSKKSCCWYKVNMNYENDADMVVITLVDVTSERNFSKKLQSALVTDNLTGLQNRAGLSNYLETVLNVDSQNNKYTGLLIIDIDNLKNINDSLGIKEGDLRIVKVSQILNGFENSKTKIFRYGGDEFLVILSDFNNEMDIVDYTDKILSVFQDKDISISGGIAVSPIHTTQKDELIRFADMAIHCAKKNGKNNFVYFEDYMHKVFTKHLMMETKMSTAISDQNFQQVYQPQFDIKTGKLRGFEALIRWQDPLMGEIPPSVFIPLAEESGLIVQIGNWVLTTALATLRKWQDLYNFKGIISVNVSPVQLQQDNFIYNLANLVAQYGIDPTLLEVEITEGVMISNMNVTIDKLQAIKDMGIRVSLDDFGTGYSSLSYLQMLPLNTLKIDKSFINNITSEDGIQANITSAIINMVKCMGLETIAEGVEHPEQLELLHKFHCNVVQGFLRGKPMSLAACEDYLSGNEGALITL
ncbi:MAG: bifunctional diguanylate cyclase/phosphodiesterase [Treponema sp.]|nr:bifunctional diguanylate cyclase/phosphodiesterase [Treponema sp.]